MFPLTRTNWEGTVVLGISLSYVSVAILSASLNIEELSGGLSMKTSCDGVNARVLLTYWPCFCFIVAVLT